ncbi:hypothetical protein M0M57_11645 [Flavobacterium azooxidireducens]|uniref:Uncharacterized protein n=1 Tax=Flavobacterium azooxidireducens TaxID=1871076 RepID=A0ABY4KBV8_9FLAO|nr:hypothetical protein [Flavobacterium azooxidireducens]UPQ78271.1 hypothetical protein M0M57_11645 [Flavobacterium azooxidireducens]
MNSILVHDRKSFFYRFVSIRYSTFYSIEKSALHKGIEVNFKNFDLLLFVIYDEVDLKELLNYVQFEGIIILCSNNDALFEEVIKSRGFLHLKLTISKIEIKKELDNLLELVKILLIE